MLCGYQNLRRIPNGYQPWYITTYTAQVEEKNQKTFLKIQKTTFLADGTSLMKTISSLMLLK